MLMLLNVKQHFCFEQFGKFIKITRKKNVCYITMSKLLVLDGLDVIGGADDGFDSLDILCFLC